MATQRQIQLNDYGKLENELEKSFSTQDTRNVDAQPERTSEAQAFSTSQQPPPPAAAYTSQQQQPPPAVLPPYYVGSPQQPMMMQAPYPGYPQAVPPYMHGSMTQSGGVQFIPSTMQQQTQVNANLLPNDYLAVVLIFFVLCTIFNITSIVLGLPALMLSIQAYNNKAAGKYNEAKLYGNIAIYLTLASVIYTLLADILIVGLTLGLYCPTDQFFGTRC